MKILKISMLFNPNENAEIEYRNIADREKNKCVKCIAVIIPDSQMSASGKNNYKVGIQNLMKAVYDL